MGIRKTNKADLLETLMTIFDNPIDDNDNAFELFDFDACEKNFSICRNCKTFGGLWNVILKGHTDKFVFCIHCQTTLI